MTRAQDMRPEDRGLRLNRMADLQERPVRKRLDLMYTKDDAAVELVWKLQGGELRCTDVGDALPFDSVATITHPLASNETKHWWELFAVLPVECRKRIVYGDWTRVGMVLLLSYHTGLRTELEVWRDREHDRTVCVQPEWTNPAAWFTPLAKTCGRWALFLWMEALERCFKAGVPLGDAPLCPSWRWFHRAWRQPREGNYLGPNGRGEEIERRSKIEPEDVESPTTDDP